MYLDILKMYSVLLIKVAMLLHIIDKPYDTALFVNSNQTCRNTKKNIFIRKSVLVQFAILYFDT
jgi:hypothetical protein